MQLMMMMIIKISGSSSSNVYNNKNNNYIYIYSFIATRNNNEIKCNKKQNKNCLNLLNFSYVYKRREKKTELGVDWLTE